MRITKLLIASIFAGLLAGTAHAAPVSLSTNFNVWQGHSPSPGDINDPTQQALPTNPLTSQTFIGFYSYTGPINFSQTNQASDLLSTWIPGAGLPALQMSSPSFDLATLFEFTFTAPTGQTIDSITHDDGISLYDLTVNSGNLIPGNSGPTTAVATPVSLIAGHNYELWYVAANGAPSILSFNGAAVPEPASWAMMMVGIGCVGGVLRRRRQLAVA